MKIIFFGLLLGAVVGCKKNSFTGNNQVTPTDTNQITSIENNRVYVVGTKINLGRAASSIAKYWINGQAVDLSNGDSAVEGDAIAVSGNDVYVVGFLRIYRSSGIPKYWENGQSANFADSTIPHAIAVTGNDVYMAANYPYGAGYWKNGQFMNLSDTAEAYDIAVSGDDVYVAGDINNVAAYWKNGQAVILTGSGSSSRAMSIAVSGNDVYIGGQERIGNSGAEIKYWKNGLPVNLNPVNYINNSDPVYVAASGSDGYVVTTVTKRLNDNSLSYPMIVYWKNGNAVEVTDGKTDCLATDIAVVGNDVYISGYQEINASAYIATYWRNGYAVNLSSGKTIEMANGIVVLPK